MRTVHAYAIAVTLALLAGNLYQAEAPTCPNPACCCDPCECGPGCDCGKAENDADKPEGGDVESVRSVVVLSASWCGPCKRLHETIGDHPGVEFTDIEHDPAEAARLWQGQSILVNGAEMQANGLLPAALPVFVLVEDGEPVMRWSPSSKPNVDAMLDWQPTVEAAVLDDVCPPWAVRVHLDAPGMMASGSGVVIRHAGGKCYALTNHHVATAIPGGRIRVKVMGEWVRASLLAADAGPDLALLEFTAPKGVVILPVATESPADGDRVTTHGFASGVVYRSQDTTLRIGSGGYSTDEKFASGESGGPVVCNGQLVGLIYASEVGDDPDAGSGRVVPHAEIVAFLSRHR